MESVFASADWRTVAAVIGAIAACIALAVNGLNFYFQHFYKFTRLYMIVSSDSDMKECKAKVNLNRVKLLEGIRIILSNSGNQAIVINSLALECRMIEPEFLGKSSFLFPRLDYKKARPHHLDPTKHVTESFLIHDSDDTNGYFLKEYGINRYADTYEVEIYAEIEALLSSGDLIKKNLKVADVCYMSNTKGISLRCENKPITVIDEATQGARWFKAAFGNDTNGSGTVV